MSRRRWWTRSWRTEALVALTLDGDDPPCARERFSGDPMLEWPLSFAPGKPGDDGEAAVGVVTEDSSEASGLPRGELFRPVLRKKKQEGEKT